MAKKKNDYKSLGNTELVKSYYKLIKRKIVLVSQSRTGSPPKNNQELYNVKKNIARILTIMRQKGMDTNNIIYLK